MQDLNIQRFFQRTFIVTLIGLATSAAVSAQSGRPGNQPQRPVTASSSGTLQVELLPPVAETPVPLLPGSRPAIETLSFVTPDANFERTFVKGAAFSAEATTEHVQTLNGGNRMVRKSAARIFRDSAGRTRREHELNRGGAAPDGQPPRLIVINDPLGRVNYIIETETGIARKRELPPQRVLEALEKSRGDNAPFSVLIPASTAHRRMTQGDAGPPLATPRKEELPAQTIEGVLAQGTRTTIVIPPGEFDNEQPLTITHEEWYAPELHMIVLMKHIDPRFGETTFQLKNIFRGEPAPDLFQLPSGYRVIDGRDRGRMIGPRTSEPIRRPQP